MSDQSGNCTCQHQKCLENVSDFLTRNYVACFVLLEGMMPNGSPEGGGSAAMKGFGISTLLLLIIMLKLPYTIYIAIYVFC